MITKENLKEVLEILGFEALSTEGKKLDSKSLESKQAHIYTKTINSYTMQVNFASQKLIYPQGIKINDATTSNFSHPENFVVFECVHRLLEQGYKVLETIIDKGYTPQEEIMKIKDSHLIIYQMPVWWMGEP